MGPWNHYRKKEPSGPLKFSIYFFLLQNQHTKNKAIARHLSYPMGLQP